jgi:neutral ceramidase
MMQEQLWVGTEQLIINPPFGSEMSGFNARTAKSQGVHDPLWAKALVISDGREKVALVIADLVGIDSNSIEEVRTKTAELTDIAPDRVIIGATHTHSGPVVFSEGHLGRGEPSYKANLVQNLSGAVFSANQNLEPVDLWVGESECRTVGKNRRKAGGPTDPQLLVLRFEGAKGTKALMVNYACHPVVLGPDNLLISADYPYYLRSTLESLYPGAQIMFTNGAAGVINTGHSASSSIIGAAASAQSKRTFSEARRLGRILAGQALEASENAVKQDHVTIRFKRQQTKLLLEPVPTVSEYEKLILYWEAQAQESKGNQNGYLKALTRIKWATEMRDLRISGKIMGHITAEISALAIGDLELATLPGEFFHELGLKLKRARSPKKVVVLGYTNGKIGYVPDAPAYDEGGYEVDESYPLYGLPSRLVRGSGEQVIEALQNALISMNRSSKNGGK